MALSMGSLRQDYAAIVVGANGGIGNAVAELIGKDERCGGLIRLDRHHYPAFDLTDESSIAAVANELREAGLAFDLIFDATGALEIDGAPPEKTIRKLDPKAMAAQFAVNAIGPALLIKHLTPLLQRDSKSVFASISARVGSIGDNQLGGWISYRSAKAALNQIIKTASIELARHRPGHVCIALHPGTVATRLSEKYAGNRETFTPEQSAQKLLSVIDRLEPGQSGDFFAYDGAKIEW